MGATVLSWWFSWVWSGMRKVLSDNKSPICLERVEWFCWFFDINYLHFVKYLLKLKKICYFGLASSDIAAQPIRLSDVLKGKNTKRYEVLSRFFAFIEARRIIMLLWVMTPKYSWPIILQHFLLLNCLTHIT